MRILVIEDDKERALALSQLLADAGHQTSILLNVRGMGRRGVAGDGIDGVDVVLEPDNFDFAFIDGVLGEKSRWHGWDVIPSLVRSDIVCIAMSREDTFNDRMKAGGAHFTVLKDNLWKEHVRLLDEAARKLVEIRA